MGACHRRRSKETKRVAETWGLWSEEYSGGGNSREILKKKDGTMGAYHASGSRKNKIHQHLLLKTGKGLVTTEENRGKSRGGKALLGHLR